MAMLNDRHRARARGGSRLFSSTGTHRVKARVASSFKLFAVGVATVFVLSACSKAPRDQAPTGAQSTPLSTTQQPAPATSSNSSSELQSGASSATSASSSTTASIAHEATSVTTCQASSLSVKRISGDAGMGSIYEGIALTNTGHQACILSGTPGVQRVSSNGKRIPPLVSPKSLQHTPGRQQEDAPITLQPHQSAYLTLGLNNLAPDGSPYVPKQCKATRLAEVQFTWEGSNTVAHMPQNGYGCTTGIDKLQVQPFSRNKPAS